MTSGESDDSDGGGNAASSKSIRSSPERVYHGRNSEDPLDKWVIFRSMPIDAGWWMMGCRFPAAEKDESMRWFGLADLQCAAPFSITFYSTDRPGGWFFRAMIVHIGGGRGTLHFISRHPTTTYTIYY